MGGDAACYTWPREDAMKRLRWLVIALLAGMLVAGCGTRAAEMGRAERSLMSEAAPSAAEAKRSADAAGAGGSSEQPAGASLPAARMVIKTASLSVRVKDVAAASARAIQLTESRGGYVQSSSQSTEGGERADLTLRVPPEGFLPLIGVLERLGTPEATSISGQDVTEEYYDLDARLENLGEVRSRLFDLLKKAVKVADAVEVERELERVGGEINQIKGRMKYLSAMTGLATIDVSLYTDDRPAAAPFVNWALIANGFVVAARWLVRAVFFILQALVVLIPLGAILGAAAFGTIRLVRFLRARRAPTRKRKA
jgi:hypothetical protein